MDAEAILKAVNSVTDDWTKRRKKEERGSSRSWTRHYSSRVAWTDVAPEILPKAYEHASGNGSLSLPQRMFYYAAREAFFKATGRQITQERFNTILLQFMNNNQDSTSDWRITKDPRGTFQIPNTRESCKIPVGTIDIDNYLTETSSSSSFLDNLTIPRVQKQYPTKKAGERFAAVLYIEKEGFGPMLQEARIAERYDVAILSCKGQSVVAARKLVDQICNSDGVPLFIVHDFDKAGFEIRKCLTTESELAIQDDRVAYYFENEIEVTDFGLRLDDATKYDLQSETVKFKGKLPDELGLTPEEKDYLKSNRRIELNAFTATEFIEWLENKLDKHLPERLIPSDDVIDKAYRRAFSASKINRQISVVEDGIREEAKALEIPKDLRSNLKLKIESSDEPWDIALYEIVEETSH